MQLRFRFSFGTLAVCLLLCGTESRLPAQLPTPVVDVSAALPDAPSAQVEASVVDPIAPQQPSLATTSAPPNSSQSSAQPAGAQDSSSAPAAAEKAKHEKAEEQLRQQEHQRVAGVMATFNTTRNRDALPLSPSQKFRLFFRSAVDPWPFFLNGITAGIGQANNSPPEWGQGLQGYAKRFGGNYSDYFIGNFFGNAVLPSLMHEDPRYFQKGTGSHGSRLLWAAASSFWCRRDNGKWGPNYANVGGNLIGAAIARTYYPVSERNATDTITDGLTVTVEGIVGAEVIEFWPDLDHYLKRKHAEKLARKAAQSTGKGAAPAEVKK